MSNNFVVKRELCPACQSKKFKTIYSCGFLESPIREYLASYYFSQGYAKELDCLEGAKFILNECSNCGLVFQEEVPNDYLTEIIYDKWVGLSASALEFERQNRFRYDDFARYAQEIMMALMYFEANPKQPAFLDFGMGWGYWCLMAKAWGCDSYGCEISKSRVEYAQSQCIKVISLKEIPNHSFDFINAEQVFEHIPEPLETLLFLKQSLKAEGLIRISVPDGGDIKRRLKKLDWTAPRYSRNSLMAVSPLEHINCFNHGSITEMAEIAGFEQVKIPLSLMYASSTNWKNAGRALKNILVPLYRNVLSKGTILFFRKRKLSS